LSLWLLCRHVNKNKLIAFLLSLDTIANTKYIVIIFVILLLAYLLSLSLSLSLAREANLVSTVRAFPAL
jgi:hypothetical protein